MKNFDYEKAVI